MHACRSKHYEMIVAVAAAFGSLEIIGLRGLYGAETRAATHHIHYQSGQFGCGYVAYTFLFETHTGT